MAGSHLETLQVHLKHLKGRGHCQCVGCSCLTDRGWIPLGLPVLHRTVLNRTKDVHAFLTYSLEMTEEPEQGLSLQCCSPCFPPGRLTDSICSPSHQQQGVKAANRCQIKKTEGISNQKHHFPTASGVFCPLCPGFFRCLCSSTPTE